MVQAAETTAGSRPRYVVAEDWEHIFPGQMEPEAVSWVYDRVEERLVAGLMKGGDTLVAVRRHGYVYKPWMTPMTQDALEDVEDSVKNANPEAIDHPEEWDLEETDVLPGWAVPVDAQPAPGT